MSKYINIEVTREDYEKGGYGFYDCPVAKALHRQYPTLGKFSVCVSANVIILNGVEYVPSENLSNAIDRYDAVNVFELGRYRAFKD